MKRMLLSFFAMLAMPAAVWAQQAGPDINGLVFDDRIFNDIPGSTLFPTNGNSVNMGALSFASITDTFVGPATGANRHDFLLSADGGATVASFNIDDSFTFKTLVNLAPANNTPRKEAGIRLNAPSGFDDALFIVNSDAGEIVAFGGPFHRFDSPGNTYTPGTTILMGFTLKGGGGGTGGAPTTIQYFVDRDGPGAGFGVQYSPVLPFTNLEGGLPTYTVAMYGQGGPGTNTADVNNVVFSDIMYTAIPEPSTVALGLAALMGLVAIRRR
jgi:hypothetical protein